MLPDISSVVDPAALGDIIAAEYPVGRPTNCHLVSQNINDTYYRVEVEDLTYYARLARRGWLDVSALEAEARVVMSAAGAWKARQ